MEQNKIFYFGVELNKEAIDALPLSKIQAQKAQDQKMHKNIFRVNFFNIAAIALACTMDESIQRDVMIGTSAFLLGTSIIGTVLTKHRINKLDLFEYIKTQKDENIVCHSTKSKAQKTNMMV